MDPATETTGQQVTRTEFVAGEGTPDWEAYAYGQRERFVESMEAELAEINRRIDALAIRIERSSEEAKAAATPRLNELRDQADLLEARIDEVRGASASTWETVKANTRETYEKLKDSFDEARQ